MRGSPDVLSGPSSPRGTSTSRSGVRVFVASKNWSSEAAPIRIGEWLNITTGTSTFPGYASDRKIAPRDCAVCGAAQSRQSTTEELEFEREFRENRTTPPE
jgi:hypothetical protein